MATEKNLRISVHRDQSGIPFQTFEGMSIGDVTLFVGNFVDDYMVQPDLARLARVVNENGEEIIRACNRSWVESVSDGISVVEDKSAMKRWPRRAMIESMVEVLKSPTLDIAELYMIRSMLRMWGIKDEHTFSPDHDLSYGELYRDAEHRLATRG